MKYSRTLMIALLGEDCFETSEVVFHRKFFGIETRKSLDVFTALLFFFLYEPGFRPNRFIRFLCGIGKITDLNRLKGVFRENLDASFRTLSEIRVHGAPFLRYERAGNRWNYSLSPEALSLRETFICELNSEDFWTERRRGVAVAYLGAYIYLMGVLGKTEIDLKYLGDKRWANDFCSGYPVWKARKIVKDLVLAFAGRGVFRYGRRLERMDDHVLHVKSVNPANDGLRYRRRVEDFVFTRYYRNVWRDGKIAGRRQLVLDLARNRETLSRQVAFLNDMAMDVRYGGRRLPDRISLEFEDSALRGFIRIRCPVSGIRRAEWKNVTFGSGGKAAVIEIEHLRTLYTLRQFRKRGVRFEELPSNRLFERTPQRHRGLLMDFALESMQKYYGQPGRMRQSFRWKLHHYLKQGAVRREINSFMYFVSERCFHSSKGAPDVVSDDDFVRRCLRLFFGTVWELGKIVPMIVTPCALIVPEKDARSVLSALGSSYRRYWGDRRKPRFRVTTADAVRRYRFTNSSQIRETTT